METVFTIVAPRDSNRGFESRKLVGFVLVTLASPKPYHCTITTSYHLFGRATGRYMYLMGKFR